MKRSLFAVAASSLALTLGAVAPAFADDSNSGQRSASHDSTTYSAPAYGSRQDSPRYERSSGDGNDRQASGDRQGRYGEGNDGQSYGDHHGQGSDCRCQDGNRRDDQSFRHATGDTSNRSQSDACAERSYGKDGHKTAGCDRSPDRSGKTARCADSSGRGGDTTNKPGIDS